MGATAFKFLESYQNTEEDRANFYGRDQEISILYDKVYESNLLLFYGASGTGKTSLVNCGLGKKFSPSDWLPIFIRRGNNILESLDNAVHKHFRTPAPRLEFDEDGQLMPVPITKKIKRLYLNYYKPIFLVFDQFEELFIFGDDKEQEQFYNKILEILNSTLQCRIILVMREEFLAQLSDFEKRLPSLFDNRFRLEPMTDANLKRVIVGTIQSVENLKIAEEEETSDQILLNLKPQENERISLTNLQVYLDRLYREELKRHKEDTAQKVIDPAIVKQVGPLKNVLSQFLEEQLKQLEGELATQFDFHQSGLPLKILFEFVTTRKTKQRLMVSEVIEEYTGKGIPEPILEYIFTFLQNNRILKTLDD